MTKEIIKTADGIAVHCAHDKLSDVASLTPHPRNPNKHPESQIDLLGNVIESRGWRLSITVSLLSGLIIRGNGRYLAAKKKGWWEVPVDYQEYENEYEEWADLVADNKLAELAEMSKDDLYGLLEDMDRSGKVKIEMSGFTAREMVEMERDRAFLEKEAPKPQKKEHVASKIHIPTRVWLTQREEITEAFEEIAKQYGGVFQWAK